MNLRLTSFGLLATLALAAPVGATLIAEDPYVIEWVGFERLEYEIVNPAVSTVGDVVALVIDIDPTKFSWFDAPWVDTNNGWEYDIFLDPATQWDSAMTGLMGWGREFDLTWRQFFGGMDYPYPANQPAAGYWIAYSAAGGGGYEFDSPELAVSPGERLDGFYAYGSMPCSTFYLAHIGDAGTDTFDENGLPCVSGEAIPEPATLALLALGALALVRRRR